jgi:homoserine kinase
MSAAEVAVAFAPASIGNVAVGFDMLGLAIAGPGDRVIVRRSAKEGVRLAAVRDPQGEVHRDLPADAARNTASIAASAFWSRHGDGGLDLEVEKGIPLESGMGSSAASAVAAVVAANALLASPLAPEELLPFALEGERYASGERHADNVAPSLLGGLVLCPPFLLPRTVAITPPPGISSVLLHPDLKVGTAGARRALSRTCTMEQWLAQQAYLAAFVLACERGDPGLIRQSLHDVVIEPQRTGRVPPFEHIKAAALREGALGSSLSGSGPSVFALVPEPRAAAVAEAMEMACRDAGHACESWVSPMNAPGAQLVEHA